MHLAQLQAQVAQAESETLEFKQTTGERREAMQVLFAMLNHRGGRVLFGVEPTEKIIGQQVSGHTLEDVTQEIQQIDLPVFPTAERVDVTSGLQVMSITVTTGANRGN